MPEVQIGGAWMLVGAWVGSAVVRGMPQPPEDAPYWLRWLYNACQILGTNFDLVVRRNKEKGTTEKP